MKIAGLLLAGILLGWSARHWRRPSQWVFTRIPPATPPDHQPRFRTWHHGVEVPP